MCTFKKYEIKFADKIFPQGFIPFSHEGVLLAYNPHSGKIMRKTKFGDIRIIHPGTHKGYTVTNIKGKNVYAHRLIARYFLNAGFQLSDGQVVDHIESVNGTAAQDRLENLRITTMRGNRQNLKNGSSTLSGVRFHKQSGKWQARICIEEKQKHLGLFNTEIDAGLIYRNALKLYGFDTTIVDEKILAYQEKHGLTD